MSRYSVEAKDPEKFTVMVGWDKDYQTFFAQVMRKDSDRDWDMALWKSTNPRELNSVEELQRAVKEFVDIPKETVVVKYVGDTFLDLSYEKQPAHPDKKGSPVPPEGPQRECLSAGRVESVAV